MTNGSKAEVLRRVHSVGFEALFDVLARDVSTPSTSPEFERLLTMWMRFARQLLSQMASYVYLMTTAMRSISNAVGK
jgi:hypothetical protein